MGLITKLSRSSDLVSGMSQRLGVSVVDDGAADAEWAAQSYRAMVLRCSTCTEQDACTRLQADHPTLDTAPAYCRNRDRFAG